MKPPPLTLPFGSRKGALPGRMGGEKTQSLCCSESPVTVTSRVTGLGKEAGR